MTTPLNWSEAIPDCAGWWWELRPTRRKAELRQIRVGMEGPEVVYPSYFTFGLTLKHEPGVLWAGPVVHPPRPSTEERFRMFEAYMDKGGES